MNPLVVQFLMLLWLGGLSLMVLIVFQHTKRIRESIAGGFEPARRTARTPPNAAPTPPRGVVMAEARGPDDLVAPPLTTAHGDTVRNWLKHHTLRDFAWDQVVAEFYTRAAQDPAIASYFVGIDMARLQRHFVATMIMITGRGLTAGGVRAMALAHGEVRNADGQPITGVVYDRVIDILVTVLVEFGVPGDAVDDLRRVVDPLRSAIVATEGVGNSRGRSA